MDDLDTRTDIDDVVVSDFALEKCCLGIHPIYLEGPPPKQQPLTKIEKEFYDYIKAHPNYTMPGMCRLFRLSQVEYMQIKQSIAQKGYKINGVIATRVAEDVLEPDAAKKDSVKTTKNESAMVKISGTKIYVFVCEKCGARGISINSPATICEKCKKQR